jgi:anaphase-promoting complex subunit 10
MKVTLSSYKPGFGVTELLSPDTNQFWQSDGPQPHFVLLHFHKRTIVNSVSIYVDYVHDESYTPKSLSIRGGTSIETLTEICKKEMGEVIGWVDIPFDRVGVFVLQILVLANQQHGKDTHIRALKVGSVHAVEE